AAVRDLIENWFRAYPPEDQAELRARLRSRENVEFLAAFFELYLHALLADEGHSVQVHPAPPSGITTRPDYLVTKHNEPLLPRSDHGFRPVGRRRAARKADQ